MSHTAPRATASAIMRASPYEWVTRVEANPQFSIAQAVSPAGVGSVAPVAVRFTPVIAYWSPSYGQHRERRLGVPDRAPGHGQARPGRARDRARQVRESRGLLGERGRRDGDDPAARGGHAATAGRVAERRADRAGDRDARCWTAAGAARPRRESVRCRSSPAWWGARCWAIW